MLFGYCCCEDCEIYYDDFEGDSIDTNHWTVQSGTWQLSDEQYNPSLPARGCLTTASTDAFILCDDAHPDAEVEQYVQTLLKGDEGDKLRVIVAYAASDDYYYVEVEFGQPGTNCTTFALYQVTATGTTELQKQEFLSNSVYGYYLIEVCVHDDVLTAHLSSSVFSDYFIIEDITGATGTKVGLGTGDTIDTKAIFPYFRYEKHKTDLLPDCPICDDPTNVYSCLIHFDPPIGHGIGTIDDCHWETKTGYWSIISNSIGYETPCLTWAAPADQQSFNGQGLLQCLVPHPRGTDAQYVKIRVLLTTTSAEGGVFCCWDGSGSDRLTATAQLESDSSVKVCLYENGVLISDDTVHFENFNLGMTDAFIVCEINLCSDKDNELVTATFYIWGVTKDYLGFGSDLCNGYYHWPLYARLQYESSQTPDGNYAGIETLTSVSMEFWWFLYGRHKSTEDPTCYECTELCYHDFSPDDTTIYPSTCQLYLDTSNFSSTYYCGSYQQDCDTLNGTFLVTYPGPQIQQWTSAEFDVALCLPPTIDLRKAYWEVDFEYDSGTPATPYRLTIWLYLKSYIGPVIYPSGRARLFRKYYAAMPNPANWAGENIPYSPDFSEWPTGYTFPCVATTPIAELSEE